MMVAIVEAAARWAPRFVLALVLASAWLENNRGNSVICHGSVGKKPPPCTIDQKGQEGQEEAPTTCE